ncbi:hypothetical protein SBADM41S_02572 [Streptomyces badius]
MPEGAPTVAVLYYRAHHMSGNTAFVDALCTAVEDAGGRPLPLYVASLRTPEADLIDRLRSADAIVTTVLAAGGTKPAEASAGGDDESWDAGALTQLDVPILQALSYQPAYRLGGERRGRLPAGRGHPDRGAGVRRPPDHGPLLLQGDRRGRAPGVRPRRPERTPGSPGSPYATRSSAPSRTPTRRSHSCCRPTRRSTPASATRSASTPPPAPWPCCAACAPRGTTSAPRRRSRAWSPATATS